MRCRRTRLPRSRRSVAFLGEGMRSDPLPAAFADTDRPSTEKLRHLLRLDRAGSYVTDAEKLMLAAQANVPPSTDAPEAS